MGRGSESLNVHHRRDTTLRKELQKLNGTERHRFTATFERFGMKNGWVGMEKTLLLVDVKLYGKTVCDHLWFSCGKSFERLSLKKGDEIEFFARVSKYTKGYRGYREDAAIDNPIRTDYRLSNPTKVSRIQQGSADGNGVLPL